MAVGERTPIDSGTFDELRRIRDSFPGPHPIGTFLKHEVAISTGIDADREPIIVSVTDANVSRRRFRMVILVVDPNDTAKIFRSVLVRTDMPYGQGERNVRPPSIDALLTDVRRVAARYPHIQGSPIDPKVAYPRTFSNRTTSAL